MSVGKMLFWWPECVAENIVCQKVKAIDHLTYSQMLNAINVDSLSVINLN